MARRTTENPARDTTHTDAYVFSVKRRTHQSQSQDQSHSAPMQRTPQGFYKCRRDLLSCGCSSLECQVPNHRNSTDDHTLPAHVSCQSQRSRAESSTTVALLHRFKLRHYHRVSS